PRTPVHVYAGAKDALFSYFFVSPFQFDKYLGQPGQVGVGWNVAGLTYYFVLTFGLLSFLFSLGGWRWWRFLVWAGFAVLSGLEMRLIPFFAVVSGPIAALNLQDFAARRPGPLPRVEPHWKLWSLGGRIVTLLA